MGYGNFAACASESFQGCYSDEECGSGFDCTADTECLPPPGCGPGDTCPAVCYGRCVPDGSDPGQCLEDFTGEILCDETFAPR